MRNFSEAVRFEGVGFRYGDTVALKGVTFGIPRGTIAGLVGRNGAGKSTAIHLAAGLLAPAEGRVEVGGLSFPGGAFAIKRDAGYLLSDVALFAYLTAEETLLFLGEAYGLTPPEQSRRTEDLLRFFDLVEARSRLPDELSTGTRKRLALAAALVHSPSILFLDEPFESLDPLFVRRLKRLLVRYREGGGTVLLSSHLIGVVEEICESFVILERGALVAQGKLEELRSAAESGLPARTLEQLYASVVAEEPDVELSWLLPQPPAPSSNSNQMRTFT